MAQQDFKLHLTFDDEFKTFQSSPDGSVGWMTKLPYSGDNGRTLWGNQEAQYYSDNSVGENPFHLNNGSLSITATPAAPGTTPEGQAYRSGAITTFGSFAQTYGYFAARVELPAGQGLWPAFWMLPADNVYSSELDVFEQLGNDPTTVYSTTHGETGSQWLVNFNPVHTVDTSTGFHTYGVDWEPTTTTFYIDGHKTASVPTPASMNSPMYMILNLAVGGPGSWPGQADPSKLPASMKIAWVRAYATAATRDISGPAAITGASNTITATDLSQAIMSANDWTASSLTSSHGNASTSGKAASQEHSISAQSILPQAHTASQSHGIALSMHHIV